jgi:hypothetical protein
MREALTRKLTAGGIAGALVLGIGAIAGAATSGGSDPAPTSTSHLQITDSGGHGADDHVTDPTLGVTTPTLDDHGTDEHVGDDVNDDHGTDAVEDENDDAVDDEDDDAVEDDHSGSGSPNSGPGSIDGNRSGPGGGTDDAPGDDNGSGGPGSDD